jgi:general secretion pathway protein A
VLLIDEAQHLSAEALEELRVVASLAVTRRGCCRSCWSDNRPARRARRRRPPSARSADLTESPSQALERDDVEQYIAHRLTVAGESVSVIFEPAAVKRVHELSAGVPRVINLLCDRR